MLTYQMIREDKNEELLIQLIKDGKLGINDRNKEGMDPMILAVDCEFSLDTLKQLIELGCSVNNSDQQGRTALHYAVDLENAEIIKFLLENGADPDAKDTTGSSPRDEVATDEALERLFPAKAKDEDNTNNEVNEEE